MSDCTKEPAERCIYPDELVVWEVMTEKMHLEKSGNGSVVIIWREVEARTDFC